MNSLSIIFRKFSPFIIGFIGMTMVIQFILSPIYWNFPTQNEYMSFLENREIRENTAIEMLAEDVWKNGHATLKSFNPNACKVEFHNTWLGRWKEVTCITDDEKGNKRLYQARYGVSREYLNFIFRFLDMTYPAREMKNIH